MTNPKTDTTSHSIACGIVSNYKICLNGRPATNAPGQTILFCRLRRRLARARRASRKVTPVGALYLTVFPCTKEVGWPSPRAWYLVVLGATRGWVRTWRVSWSASLLPGPLGQSHGESWACSHTWRFSLVARARLVVSPRAWNLAVRVAVPRMRRIMIAVRSEGSCLGSLSQSS